MAGGYKKYMKNQQSETGNSFIQLFILSFFAALLVFVFLIKSFSPSVDVSIGGDRQEQSEVTEDGQPVDGRLSMIQEEDRGRDFSELIKKSEEAENNTEIEQETITKIDTTPTVAPTETFSAQKGDPIYKVFIGSYSTAEQAKVAKDIILESGLNITPIVKCLGSTYTLQVGTFKNKNGAEELLNLVLKNNLQGRISQEY